MALAASQEQHDETAAARPERAGLAGYDAAVRALEDAAAAIAEDDIEARCHAVQAATEAVTTMYLDLDIRRCGELVQSLSTLYHVILGRLLRINLDNDPATAREAIELLEPFRAVWAAGGDPLAPPQRAAGPQ
ncbi:MAG: flagellar export chaperone FliS [Kiloniellaceae bacterium]